jgi:hydroxyethylthiazole kinase-like uncharacterized protein yjeF
MHVSTLSKLLHRPPAANKYDFGHVLIVGGSPGTVGAPLLAAMAAMRTGAGLVTIAAYGDTVDALEERVLEVMTLRLPASDVSAARTIKAYCTAKKVTAVAIGSGLLAPHTSLARQLLPELTVPVILDAGGLTAYKNNLETLASLGSKNPAIVATPHDGEYQQLTGTVLPPEGDERKKIVTEFAVNEHITLVAKGHHTLVAHPDGTVYKEMNGNPGMAKAGTGDVLTGIIAGLLAQGTAVNEAAEIGVHLHAVAGDIVAKSKTQAGIIASDIIDAIPLALRQASGN